MDATFWAMIALFIFLGVVVYLKVPGMIAKALDERAAKIRNELEEARRLREEAQQLLAEFQKKRKEAEKEAAEMVAAAKRESDLIIEDAHKKTEEYVARRAALAEQKIGQAEREAVNEVRSIAVDVATEAARKRACRQARRKDQRRAVQGFAEGGPDQAELTPFDVCPEESAHDGGSDWESTERSPVLSQDQLRPTLAPAQAEGCAFAHSSAHDAGYPSHRRRCSSVASSRNGEKLRRCSRAQAPAISIAARCRSVA